MATLESLALFDKFRRWKSQPLSRSDILFGTRKVFLLFPEIKFLFLVFLFSPFFPYSVFRISKMRIGERSFLCRTRSLSGRLVCQCKIPRIGTVFCFSIERCVLLQQGEIQPSVLIGPNVKPSLY